MINPALCGANLDQVQRLDELGLDLVWFTEHHFVEDGYLPSWIPFASAMASRTRQVRFSCDVCLLPLHHPIRLAEDLAVLDNISSGRVEDGLGGLRTARVPRLRPTGLAACFTHRRGAGSASASLHRRSVRLRGKTLHISERHRGLRAERGTAALGSCDG
jgi:hypothetical protein